MSKNYTMIKNFYDKGLWDITRVKNVVGKINGITKSEYQDITGIQYIE